MDTTTLPPPPAKPHLPPPPRPPLSNDVEPIRRRPLTWLVAAAMVVATVATLIWIDPSPIGVLVILFVLVVPFERKFPRHRGQKLRRPRLAQDIGYLLASPVMTAIGLVVAIPVAVISFAWLPGLAIRPLVAMIPPSVLPFVGIALFDLAIYWVHRWSHEVPFLWRFHSIHHSPESMDWVSGFRLHPFDGAIVAPPFIFLIAAGFDAEFSGVLAAIQIILGLFLHANVRWRLRPLHKIVMTPEFHHWHHANEPGAINSNYSVFLPLWDLVFGTYFMPKNRRPQRYGVTEPIPAGMSAQLLHPLRGMVNPLTVLRHPVRSITAGWRYTRAVLRDVRASTFRPTRTARAVAE